MLRKVFPKLSSDNQFSYTSVTLSIEQTFYMAQSFLSVYCAAGYEVNENETNACLPCKRGYYKDNEGNSKFETCKQCVGKTTDNIASESEDLCEYG